MKTCNIFDLQREGEKMSVERFIRNRGEFLTQGERFGRGFFQRKA
jgi:hypothetical protein